MLKFPQLSKQASQDVWYTLRRHFVDSFYFEHVPRLHPGSFVLDLGGDVVRKRGFFDIGKYPLEVIAANYSASKKPNVQADGRLLPFKADIFDAVICSEVLEHVFDPELVLLESQRVLKPNGILLVCVPFMVKIHGDPDDFGRYTDSFWKACLQSIGFETLLVQKQGLFWCVMCDMFRDLTYSYSMRMRRPIIINSLSRFMGILKNAAIKWDNSPGIQSNPQLTGYTTGFGILARKR